MMHIWEYQDATGVTRKGVVIGHSDFGGTDVSMKFHRLDDAGKPIRYPNGGRAVDVVNGPALKCAKHIGTMTPADYAA